MSLLPGRTKQRIHGLRKGNTVLIYFWSGVLYYQCVLIALASDLSTNKPRQDQHKFWRYVSAIRTYFAWLLEIVGSLLLRNAPPSPPRAPLAGTGVPLPAFHEGRAGLAISGVFGAGKTRSAAALLAGLLGFDPSL